MGEPGGQEVAQSVSTRISAAISSNRSSSTPRTRGGFGTRTSRVDGDSYLLSYKAYSTLAGQTTYIVAQHDTQYLVDEVFPRMFVSDETTPIYDIVDESNQVVFGPDLTSAGVYTVDHRFPTTLYRWRLQVAPRQAARLQARGRSRMRGEVALPLMSFAIILLSAIFFIYAAEKERRLNQLKSELMANVSHELKTPLSVVRMFSDMLRSGRVPSEERKLEYLDIICRESERLTSLIDNMLDFSALEGGKGPYRLRRGDLGEAVDRALDAFRYRSEQDGVEIHLERSDELPPVLIDQEAIALAVINLLDNAVKYGGQTPVELELTTKRSSVDSLRSGTTDRESPPTHFAACSSDSIEAPTPTRHGARGLGSRS